MFALYRFIVLAVDTTELAPAKAMRKFWFI